MQHQNIQKAVFAAGCFWGVESAFNKLDGVIKTRVGYTGGKVSNPTYEQVCTSQTGHAEAVEVIYDQKRISYQDLLQNFWKIHDPTTLNQQGSDVGTQYRSAIFYLDDHQKELADKSKRKMESTGILPSKIVTEITKASAFYPAEDYHQKYFLKHPGQGCKN